jgi:hypothetical protein
LTGKSGVVVCVTIVTASGTWSCTLADPLPDGAVTLTATQTDAAGNVSGPTTVTFAVSTQAPKTPRIDEVAPDRVLGKAGAADPFAIITVTWPDGSTSTTVAKADGSWSVERPAGMSDGLITATATNAAGRTSAPATAQVSTPPAVAPPAPVAPTGGQVR